MIKYVTKHRFSLLYFLFFFPEFPVEIGKKYKGETPVNYCLAGLVPRDAYFVVERVQRHETLKSFARVCIN